MCCVHIVRQAGWPFFAFQTGKGKALLIHQSDLAAASRCLAEYGYKRAGMPTKTNSAAAYGSVMHHSVQVLERALATGTSWGTAKAQAIESFLWFWRPTNIEAICEPIPGDGWLPRQDYSSLRQRGVEVLEKYADLIRFEDLELLGTEVSFVVPIEGTWDEDLEEPHYLAGSIDLLAVNFYKRYSTVNARDYKTGRDYQYLRWNLQGTAYCYSTTRPEFWTGFNGIVNGRPMVEEGFGAERGQELYERFIDAPRRFTWVNLRSIKFEDGGWRGPDDYTRFALAVQQFCALTKAEIFPMTMTGTACRWCDFRSICGGTGVPAPDHGAPDAH